MHRTTSTRPPPSPGRPRRRSPARLCAGLALVAGLSLVSPGAAPVAAAPRHAGAPDSYVAQWDAVGTSAFTAAGLSPAEGHLILAYASIAVYDSVMAVQPRYQPFAVHEHAPTGTSAEAAGVAAAPPGYHHHPPAPAAPVIAPAYAASSASIADGPAKSAGLALGERVAAALIAQRADDGFRLPVGYPPPDPPVPGVWLPTAP